MKSLKRGLAVFLAVLLMVPSMPATPVVYAAASDAVQEGATDEPPESEAESTENENDTTNLEVKDKESTAADPEDVKDKESTAADPEDVKDKESTTADPEDAKDSTVADTEDAKDKESTVAAPEDEKDRESTTADPEDVKDGTVADTEDEKDKESTTTDTEDAEDKVSTSVDTEDDGDRESVDEDAEDEDTADVEEEAAEADEEAVEIEVTDEVLFNTGNHVWQIVNEEAFTEGEIGDGCFEEDGSYTIHIPEVNPFFPYEVQFTYNEEVMNHWFMSPDDSVEIGGHIFHVSADFDGEEMTQMSLSVAGDTIIVYPEEKEFTNDGDGAMVYSLQPLEEIRLSGIDLQKYTPAELTMVSVNAIFGEDQVNGADSVVWTYFSDSGENYTVSPINGVLDLSYYTYSSSYPQWEMIVGTADQLDRNNKRYIVSLNTTNSRNWLTPKAYLQGSDGNYSEISVLSANYYDYYNRSRYQNIYVSSSLVSSDTEVYVTLDVNKAVFPDRQFDYFKIYEGSYTTVSEAESGTDITELITGSGKGYPMQQDQNKWITMVTYKDGSVTGCLPFYLHLGTQTTSNWISSIRLYRKDGNSLDSVQYTYSQQTTDGCVNYTSTLYAEFADDEEYYLDMNYHATDNSAVIAAYEGQYSSIAEAKAADKENIKDSLFNQKEGLIPRSLLRNKPMTSEASLGLIPRSLLRGVSLIQV